MPNPSIIRIDGTIIPVSWTKLYVMLTEKLGMDVVHKKTASTFKKDEKNILTIRRQGSNDEYITLFLNKSHGWMPDVSELKRVNLGLAPTGETRVVVRHGKRAVKEVKALVRVWIKKSLS